MQGEEREYTIVMIGKHRRPGFAKNNKRQLVVLSRNSKHKIVITNSKILRGPLQGSLLDAMLREENGADYITWDKLSGSNSQLLLSKIRQPSDEEVESAMILLPPLRINEDEEEEVELVINDGDNGQHCQGTQETLINGEQIDTSSTKALDSELNCNNTEGDAVVNGDKVIQMDDAQTIETTNRFNNSLVIDTTNSTRHEQIPTTWD